VPIFNGLVNLLREGEERGDGKRKKKKKREDSTLVTHVVKCVELDIVWQIASSIDKWKKRGKKKKKGGGAVQ